MSLTPDHADRKQVAPTAGPIRCSVIIPSFNSAAFIDVALFSLMQQTRRPDEVIIVDAGSTDSTRELVETFRDGLNINFLTAPRTSMGVARNIGIRAATGDAICFLDTDDIFLAPHVEQACDVLGSRIDIDAVHGFQVQWNSVTDRLEMGYDYLRPLDHDAEIFESSLVNLSTFTVRRSFLVQNNLLFSEGLQGRYCEDWDFMLRLIAAGMRIHYLQEPVSVVTERSGSHTRKTIFWKMRFCLLRSLMQQRAVVAGRRDAQTAQRIDTAIDTQRFKSTMTMLTADRPHAAAKLLAGLRRPKFRLIATLAMIAARLVPSFGRLSMWTAARIGGYGHWRPRQPVELPADPALAYLRRRLLVRN